MAKRFIRISGYYLFVALVNLLAVSVLYVITLPAPIIPAQAVYIRHSPDAQRPAEPAISGTPTHLSIPGIDLSLTIKPGKYDPQNLAWTINDSNAFYATNSVPANDTNGVTLIYGHDRWGLFGDLPDLRPGTKATVDTDSGHRFTYSYASNRSVLPTDTSVFTADGSPRLVLQTCTGAWDSYRALYTFKFIGEQSV